MTTLAPVYDLVSAKLSTVTYWKYYCEHLILENALTELTHSLDVLELTEKGTIGDKLDTVKIEEKILFYEEVKKDILNKIQVLVIAKDKKVIERIEVNDNITL